MNNTPNKFKTTRDVDQWLTNGGEMPSGRRIRPNRPKSSFKLPLPKFGRKPKADEAPGQTDKPGQPAKGKGRRFGKGAKGKPRQTGPKQPKVVAATISGLIFALIVLLAETGLWGAYCYSRTLPGDTNVQASTFMYCLAVFAGSFWAAAVVKRRSLKPCLIICGLFLAVSLIVSLQLFSLKEIKLKMFLLKILLTFVAAAAGYILSLVPYLINKSIKQKRQAQEQRRQRQLERRQLMQQQRELEQELARRSRNRFM